MQTPPLHKKTRTYKKNLTYRITLILQSQKLNISKIVFIMIQKFLTIIIRHFALHPFHVHFAEKATNGCLYTCALPGLHSHAKFRRRSDEWFLFLAVCVT